MNKTYFADYLSIIQEIIHKCLYICLISHIIVNSLIYFNALLGVNGSVSEL